MLKGETSQAKEKKPLIDIAFWQIQLTLGCISTRGHRQQEAHSFLQTVVSTGVRALRGDMAATILVPIASNSCLG